MTVLFSQKKSYTVIYNMLINIFILNNHPNKT
ncbi:hypothetical protein G5S_0774 [Chlamydia pecorum E58]|uniref:Uncharacterized protein n=1 Tax=Chlamydia pecorum (strain ATCC VR-628 / DSM 29919 / E58) TaxID=331635 RepID=A0AA34RDJ0_CHLPE|nr:hypothetical protein G5S_0774 [Chlamydia pecorum E58]